MRQPGFGKSFAPKYPSSDIKKEDYPAPNNYNPREIQSKKNIITTYADRAPL